ncbi:MAG: DUF1844 domain-containing protein [Myxococcales bacterium]|nr:DUF1844 domain-containing protein [Myxococcales bacterium]
MSAEKQGETFVMREPGPPDKPIEFSTFVLGLASTALIHLGEAPHPEAGEPKLDLVLARQSLELLSLLREKTKGNLTPEEERLFEGVLADLRFRFVEASKR